MFTTFPSSSVDSMDKQDALYRVDALGTSVNAYISIAGESLLSADPQNWQTYIGRIGLENMRGVFAKEELIGGLGMYRMGQWFGGRPIASAGISGVAIHPGHRGTGACAVMMRSVLRELYDEGIPLSSLYASTQRLYHQCGYTQAGTQTQYSMPIQELVASGIALDRTLPVHRFASPPLDSLRYAEEVRARQSSGLLQRSDGLWQRLLNPYDGRGSITYLFGEEAKPEGYVILRPGVRERGVPQPLVSTDVVTNTPRALQRLVALLYDHRSMMNDFHWFGSPNDALVLFSNRSLVHVLQQLRWLLRIVHLPLAIAQRRFPPFVNGELHLEVDDPLIDRNSGRWVVSFCDAAASVQRGGQGTLRCDIGWLSPLFSSYMTPTQLVNIGKLTTNGTNSVIESQLQLASAAFAGPAPWLPELF
jgi:predicted acetyltransferase